MRDERRSYGLSAGRALAFNRFAYRLFSTRWFWLACGLLVGGCGAYIALTSHLAQFQPITGTLADYRYSDGDLALAGHATVYRFIAADFHPTLPASIRSGTPVTIWVLSGYAGIDALQITNSEGAVLARYTDDYFDRPAFHLRENRLYGGLFGIMGGLVALASLCWPLLKRLDRAIGRGTQYGR